MNDMNIPASARTPAIAFDFRNGRLSISGESYPEDVTKFYGPILDAFGTYLKTKPEACRFDFKLIYFNSSSAKAIMMMLESLDQAAAAGTAVDIHWFHDPQDEMMEELGQEFGEDIESASFQMETQVD